MGEAQRRKPPGAGLPPPFAGEPGPFGWDPALNAILFANGVTLAGALVQHWPALPVLWVYWGQSVTIGVVNVIRMMSLREFSTQGFTSGGRQVPETPQGKASTAGFFALHFGFFHMVYAVFLSSGQFGGKVSGWMPAMIGFNVAAFAWVHAAPMLKFHGNDLRARRPNLGTLMFYPYLRIIPMHLAIILGAASPQGALPIFILLKSGADVALHFVERRLFRAPDEIALPEEAPEVGAAR